MGKWSWVQFGFGFAVAALIAFLNVPAVGLPLHLMWVILVALASGLLAGRYGDAAWQALARWLEILG